MPRETRRMRRQRDGCPRPGRWRRARWLSSLLEQRSGAAREEAAYEYRHYVCRAPRTPDEHHTPTVRGRGATSRDGQVGACIAASRLVYLHTTAQWRPSNPPLERLVREWTNGLAASGKVAELRGVTRSGEPRKDRRDGGNGASGTWGDGPPERPALRVVCPLCGLREDLCALCGKEHGQSSGRRSSSERSMRPVAPQMRYAPKSKKWTVCVSPP
jgi:hypothetical protein